MAINLKSMDKKKTGIFIGAVVAGLIAVAMTGGYIEKASEERALTLGGSRIGKDVEQLKQVADILKRENADVRAAFENLKKQTAQAIQGQSQTVRAPVEQAQTPLGVKTPQGRRAITIMIDPLSAVGGMVSPGDSVDIIGHLNVPSDSDDFKKKEQVTVTLFQNIPVLAVDGKTNPGRVASKSAKGKGSISVTVALFPDEAGLLAFAQKHGSLQLVLRSPVDTQSFKLQASTWQSLSEYLENTQGVDIGIPKDSDEEPDAIEDEEIDDETEIEIFKGGRF